jgi:cbb3-type cytochrome oxidase maturation protein
MCPNCILNQVGISPGLWVAFGVCGFFFVIGVAAMLWAFRDGQFTDIESSKFDMLDDGDSDALASKAKAAVAKLRAQQE